MPHSLVKIAINLHAVDLSISVMLMENRTILGGAMFKG